MSMGGITDFQELFNSLLSLTLCKLSNYCSSVLLVSYGVFTPTYNNINTFTLYCLAPLLFFSLRMFFSSTCSVPPFYCAELCDMLLLIFFILLWLGVLNKATAFPSSLPQQTALVP